MQFYSDYIKAWRLVKKHKWMFFFCYLLDVSFFTGFIFTFLEIVKDRIFPLLLRISQMLAVLPSDTADLQTQAAAMKTLAANLEFYALFSNLLGWLLVLAGVVLVLVIAFNGPVFSLTARIVSKKVSRLKYLLRFSIISVAFYALILLCFWLTVYLSTLNARMIIALFSDEIISFLFVLLIVLINYFWSLCVVLIMKKGAIASFLDSFRVGVREFFSVLLVYGKIVLVFGSGALLCFILLQLNEFAFAISLFFVLFPLLSYSRILFFLMMKRIG